MLETLQLLLDNRFQKPGIYNPGKIIISPRQQSKTSKLMGGKKIVSLLNKSTSFFITISTFGNPFQGKKFFLYSEQFLLAVTLVGYILLNNVQYFMKQFYNFMFIIFLFKFLLLS